MAKNLHHYFRLIESCLKALALVAICVIGMSGVSILQALAQVPLADHPDDQQMEKSGSNEKTPTELSEAEKQAVLMEDIAAIEAYLQNLRYWVARFTQIAPNGEVTEGTFYLSRPGKLRWEYDAPTPILIIARGSLVTYMDLELKEVSNIPVDQSLAAFLVNENVQLQSDGTEILRYHKTDNAMNVTLGLKENPDQGTLTLKFSGSTDSAHAPIHLTGMVIADSFGQNTTIDFDGGGPVPTLEKTLFEPPRINTIRGSR